MARSIYDLEKQETEAIDDLCRALVKLNYYASKAWGDGWRVHFTASEDRTHVAIEIARDEWPSPDSESEAAE